PDWVKGCEAEGRIVGVRQYYLDADPRLRQMGPSVVTAERPRTPKETPQTKVTPPTPEQAQAPDVPPKDTPMKNGKAITEESDEEGHDEAVVETAPVGKRAEADEVELEDEDKSTA